VKSTDDCRLEDVHPNLWAFVAVTVPLVLMPGASTAVVLRNSLAGGTRAGVETAVGLNAGSAVYGLLTAFGVAVALQRWPAVWTVLRVVGVAYLAWLGIDSLRRAWIERGGSPGPAASRPESRPLARNLSEGFLTNLLNPSVAAFYLLIVPQFIPRGSAFAASALVLTMVHVALAITWHTTWAAAGGTLAATLARRGPRRILEALTGVALLALAIKILV
jgi:threonine/homoserine/homoserine lactone efflux protein